MVTANSDMGILDMRMCETGGFQENQDVLKAAAELIDEMVRKISPVIHYIDRGYTNGAGRAFRGIEVTTSQKDHLILSRDGQWYVSANGGAIVKHDHAWMDFSFAEVIKGMHENLAQATSQKEHIAAVTRERRDMLARMVAIVRGEA